MLETLLATLATLVTFGSPLASPVPSIAVVSAIVTADEIARTDDLPTLGDVALLPDGATSSFAWHLAVEFRRDIDTRRSVGVNGLDDVLGEEVYRLSIRFLGAIAMNRACFVCDGSGQICNGCGESEAICDGIACGEDGNDDPCGHHDCGNCDGTGVVKIGVP